MIIIEMICLNICNKLLNNNNNKYFKIFKFMKFKVNKYFYRIKIKFSQEKKYVSQSYI